MKRILSILMAACLLLAPLSALAGIPDKPKAFSYVYDYADVLSSSQEETVAAYGQALRDATQATMVLLTVEFLDGAAVRDYANDVVNTWGIGDKSREDGVLLLLSVGDREIAVEPGTGLDRTLSVSATNDLIDGVIDLLKKDAYGEAMTQLYQDTCERLASSMGKRLNLSGGGSSSGGSRAGGDAYGDRRYDDSRGYDRGPSLFEVIWGIVILYVVVRVLFGRGSRRGGGGDGCGGGCLKWILIGNLFDNMRGYRDRPLLNIS
ncbi:TPM domain-containing protein [Beduinella massiliensis]|uniref:TPM domain-containing protein n=1 Tax=Beduinella massiliensis TaxID=1852363 RepID=UPI000C81741E